MELFPPTDPPSHPPYPGASQAPVWVWDGHAWVLTPAAGIDAVAATPVSGTRPVRAGSSNRSPAGRPGKRKHPARRARFVAAGLAATASVGIAVGLAVVSPPSSASNDVNDSLGTSSGAIDPKVPATTPSTSRSSSSSSSGKSTTPSTARGATPPSTTRSTPSTTQPAPIQRRPTTRSHSS